MARLLCLARRSLLLLNPSPHSSISPRPMSHVADMRKSASREHLLRLLGSETEYELRSNPPKEPVKEFDSFTVENRPGMAWIRLSRRHGEREDIKVDATMFDDFASPLGTSDVKVECSGSYGRPHISLVVDVSKGEDVNGVLQFMCSAWPDRLVVEKVFLHRRDPIPLRPIVGPDFRELDGELREALMVYLRDRGINDDLAAFLHDYMSNKDQDELVRWMKKVTIYIEKEPCGGHS